VPRWAKQIGTEANSEDGVKEPGVVVETLDNCLSLRKLIIKWVVSKRRTSGGDMPIGQIEDDGAASSPTDFIGR
jgi:hypothetical protein